jgi:hypothetical protein
MSRRAPKESDISAGVLYILQLPRCSEWKWEKPPTGALADRSGTTMVLSAKSLIGN